MYNDKLEEDINLVMGGLRGDTASPTAMAALRRIEVAFRNQADVEDYQRAIEDHNRLVRELDVLLNGQGGAAEQASLCDIVSQFRGIENRFTATVRLMVYLNKCGTPNAEAELVKLMKINEQYMEQ